MLPNLTYKATKGSIGLTVLFKTFVAGFHVNLGEESIQGSGFRALGLGFRAWDLGCEVSNVGLRCRLPDGSVFVMQELVFWKLGLLGRRSLNHELSEASTLVPHTRHQRLCTVQKNCQVQDRSALLQHWHDEALKGLGFEISGIVSS